MLVYWLVTGGNGTLAGTGAFGLTGLLVAFPVAGGAVVGGIAAGGFAAGEFAAGELLVGTIVHPARQNARHAMMTPTGLNTPTLCGSGKRTQVVLAANWCLARSAGFQPALDAWKQTLWR